MSYILRITYADGRKEQIEFLEEQQLTDRCNRIRSDSYNTAVAF